MRKRLESMLVEVLGAKHRNYLRYLPRLFPHFPLHPYEVICEGSCQIVGTYTRA